MRKKHVISAISVMIITVVTILAVAAPRVFANQSVSARYLKSSGNEIIVELNVSSLPPPLIIIVQNLPPKTEIVHSAPKAEKYSPGKGVAKWLLKNIQSGKHLVSLELKDPIQAKVTGEIRYRDNSSQMITIKIQ